MKGKGEKNKQIKPKQTLDFLLKGIDKTSELQKFAVSIIMRSLIPFSDV